MQNYDVIIPIAKHDIMTLKKNLPFITKNLNCKKIIIIGNAAIESEFMDFPFISFVDENAMIEGLNYSIVAEYLRARNEKSVRKTGWYFQQFLKMGYAKVCNNQYYLSWDSDTIPLNEIELFDKNGYPFLDYTRYVNNDKPYDIPINSLFSNLGITKKEHKSFITEHMLFSKEIMCNMIGAIEQNSSIKGSSFFEKIINSIDQSLLNLSGFSEFETYAAYVLDQYPQEYHLRKWKNVRFGTSYLGNNPTTEALEWVSKSFDAISFEDFDKQFLLCKLLIKTDYSRKHSFLAMYKLMRPFFIIKNTAIILLRKIIRK